MQTTSAPFQGRPHLLIVAFPQLWSVCLSLSLCLSVCLSPSLAVRSRVWTTTRHARCPAPSRARPAGSGAEGAGSAPPAVSAASCQSARCHWSAWATCSRRRSRSAISPPWSDRPGEHGEQEVAAQPQARLLSLVAGPTLTHSARLVIVGVVPQNCTPAPDCTPRWATEAEGPPGPPSGF